MALRIESLPSEQLSAFATTLQEQINARQVTFDAFEPERAAIGRSFLRRYFSERGRFATLNDKLTPIQNAQAEDTEVLKFLNSRRLRDLRVEELGDKTFKVGATIQTINSASDHEVNISLGPSPHYYLSKDDQTSIELAAARGNRQSGFDVRALRRIVVFLLETPLLATEVTPQPGLPAVPQPTLA